VSIVELVAVKELEPFNFRWPNGIESFERGWSFEARIAEARFSGSHGIGAREVYGRERVHTVTWIAGEVEVEGVEADDYPSSQALISRLRRPGRALAHAWDQVQAGYEGFDIVEHRREIEAPYSPQCLAIKIREDDLRSWVLHAWLRSQLPRQATGSQPPGLTRPALPPPHSPDAKAAAGSRCEARRPAEEWRYHLHPRSCRECAHPERSVRVPDCGDLRQGHQGRVRVGAAFPAPSAAGLPQPRRSGLKSRAVRTAVQQEPKLHRFVNVVPAWLVEAARIVLSRYGGDTAALWSDIPTAIELRRRLEAFPGIGQKKAAMAAEILARDLGKPLQDMSGGDIAFDVQVRRVFLRTGLAERDDVDHMVSVARALNPDRPGALDLPAWDIGRRWCRPVNPIARHAR
jgi:hypothetical protein